MTSENINKMAAQKGGAVNGILGEIVTWRSPKEIDFVKLRDALDASGLNKGLARDMLPRNAFSRSIKSLSDQRIIEKLDENETEIKFQFTREYHNKQMGQIEYNFETTLTLEKDTGAIYCSVQDIQDAAKQELDKQLQLRKSADVTRIIQKIFEETGDLFPIRDQGGAYFVPASHVSICDAVQTLLESIGGKIRRFEIAAGHGNTAESVAISVAERISYMIAEFSKNVEEFDGDMSNRQTVNASQRINELRLKLSAYSSLMEDHVEQINKEIDAANKLLSKKISAAAGIEEDDEEVASDEVEQEVADAVELEPEPEPVNAADILAEFGLGDEEQVDDQSDDEPESNDDADSDLGLSTADLLDLLK